jgi:5-methylcytosine-specific restriction endonuclease McrA
MTITSELENVSDDDLLRRLSQLVAESRRVEAVLVAHIGEVDERRLYVRAAPSMFAYCTAVLHLSEHEAYARITVARAARRCPELLVMLGDGRLHLSGIAKLAPHLTAANGSSLLARATHKTKAEIEALIAEIAPKPDVPAAVRRIPVRVQAGSTHQLGLDRVAAPGTARELDPDRVAAPGTAHQLGLDRVAGTAAGPSLLQATSRADPASRPAAVSPLSPQRYKVQFTASAELREKLERLQALMRRDLTSVIEAAVTETLARLEAKRFGLVAAPRKSLAETDTLPYSRHLPAAVRRAVRRRDGEQCTFVLLDGSRCPERRGLEFHHRHPYGRGGTHEPDNVCLMCRQHNAYAAEVDYGKERIEKYRRDDRVCEGAAV